MKPIDQLQRDNETLLLRHNLHIGLIAKAKLSAAQWQAKFHSLRLENNALRKCARNKVNPVAPRHDSNITIAVCMILNDPVPQVWAVNTDGVRPIVLGAWTSGWETAAAEVLKATHPFALVKFSASGGFAGSSGMDAAAEASLKARAKEWWDGIKVLSRDKERTFFGRDGLL